ncbi:MAG: hypothetical protein QXD03_02420 [Candidatus Anstonellales archaeon]
MGFVEFMLVSNGLTVGDLVVSIDSVCLVDDIGNRESINLPGMIRVKKICNCINVVVEDTFEEGFVGYILKMLKQGYEVDKVYMYVWSDLVDRDTLEMLNDLELISLKVVEGDRNYVQCGDRIELVVES